MNLLSYANLFYSKIKSLFRMKVIIVYFKIIPVLASEQLASGEYFFNWGFLSPPIVLSRMHTNYTKNLTYN